MIDYVGKRAGNYTIIRKLGDGGFATVYLAQHTVLEKRVAIKFLLDEWVNDPDVVNRFFDEARTMERLKDGPNIVEIIDIASKEICEREGLPPYFIMEYVNGKSLETLIHSDEKFTLEFIVNIITAALTALAYCHSKGIIHRDIKPSNILITQDGCVKLTDFGIAKAKLNTSKTTSGLTWGSPEYMSPEQILGSRDLDPRSDIYSIGVTLYEMVVGKLPFISNNSNSVALMHIQDAPVPPIKLNPACPPNLDHIILKTMEKNREDRYQSCEEMIEALKHVNETSKPVMTDGETIAPASTPQLSEHFLHSDDFKNEAPLSVPMIGKSFKNSLLILILIVVFTGAFWGLFKVYTIYNLGKLNVESVPIGAIITIDDKEVGHAPMTLTLPSGFYKVSFAMSGYASSAMQVILPKHSTVTARRTLRKLVSNIEELVQDIFSLLPEVSNTDGKKNNKLSNESLRKIEKVLTNYPDEPIIHLAWEREAINRGHIELAERYYRRLAASNPDKVLPLVMLGRIQAAEGKMKEALDAFSKAWVLDSNDILLLNSLGEYFMKAGDKARAEQYYRLSLFLDPNQTAIIEILETL